MKKSRKILEFIANTTIRYGLAKYADYLWSFIYPHTQLRKERDVALRRMMAEFIKPNDLVFDIGANKGMYTELFLSMGVREVIAVEPIARLAKKLMRPHVQSLNLALGAYNHEADFYQGEIGCISTLSLEQTKLERLSNLLWNLPIKVHVTTLDVLIQIYGEPSFIKIDAEGYETEVLAGMSFAPNALSFEFVPEDIESIERCCDKLDSLGKYLYTYTVGLGPGMQFEIPWASADNLLDSIYSQVSEHAFGDIWARRI